MFRKGFPPRRVGRVGACRLALVRGGEGACLESLRLTLGSGTLSCEVFGRYEKDKDMSGKGFLFRRVGRVGACPIELV